MRSTLQGCDASVIVASTGNNTAEKDHPDNISLAGDGFDTVIKAKAAIDAVAQCRNRVSCADILAIAARDVIALVSSFVTLDHRAVSFTVFCLSNSWACYNQAGGPSYAVELGRMDGLTSTAASVTGKLPQPGFNLNQLTSLFAANGLSQSDMIALSGIVTSSSSIIDQ